MSFVLGGLLTGVGNYLVEDARAQRDAALQALRDQATEGRANRLAATEHGYRMDESAANITRQGEQQRLTLSVSETAQAKQQERGFRHDDATREDTQQHQVLIENIQHDNRLSEDQRRIALQTQRDLEVAGATVNSYQISRDGQLTFYNDRGHALTHTRPGVYETPSEQHSSGRGRRPAASPAQQQSGSPPAPAGPDPTMLDEIVRSMQANPAYRGLSPEQLRQRAEALLARGQ